MKDQQSTPNILNPREILLENNKTLTPLIVLLYNNGILDKLKKEYLEYRKKLSGANTIQIIKKSGNTLTLSLTDSDTENDILVLDGLIIKSHYDQMLTLAKQETKVKLAIRIYGNNIEAGSEIFDDIFCLKQFREDQAEFDDINFIASLFVEENRKKRNL